MDVSPYLSAIQALKGETPGEKYKELHSIAIQIVGNDEEKDNFLKNGTTPRVSPALHPILRVLVGLKLKSKDAVIEALKSDDVTIVNLALGAKWFFNASNDLVNVDYFSEKLLPYVSLRTRHKVVKVLSKCLKAQQAESFHRHFVELFGKDQALPLLMFCGQDYIYDEILKNKMVLSDRKLKQLYRKYPQIVIRYLRFVKDGKAKKWLNDHKSFDLERYYRFLPILVKNHTPELVEFYKSMGVEFLRLGSKRAKYFLENAAEAVVENPRELAPYFPANMLKKKLSEQQYNTMLQNLFPKDITKFHSSVIPQYINKYYPKQGGFEMFRENYKKVYSHDLLENSNSFKYDYIYKVMPPDLIAQCSRKFVNALVEKSEYWKNVYKLPPKEAIPLLKEQIHKSSFLSRDEALRGMLTSCNLYSSQEDLLEVLRYYNSRHKNEQPSDTLSWLESLAGKFNGMASLNTEHWQIIKDILQRAYVKGNKHDWQVTQNLQCRVLRYLLKRCQDGESEERDKVIIEAIIDVKLEKFFEEIKNKTFFINDMLQQKEIFLENVLAVVQQNYPDTHAIWKKNNNKLFFTTNIILGMGEVNDKKSLDRSDPLEKTNRMLIQDYPLLAKFTAELFINKERHNKSSHYSDFERSLRKYFPDYCQNLIDEHPNMTNDVTRDDALRLLKQDRKKMLAKIDAYVTACRSKLGESAKSKRRHERSGKSARRFVMALKWYQGIPVKFIEKCLAEIEEKGSVLILGILLEGKVLSEIIEPYFPKETQLKVDSENAKKEYELATSIPRAFNYANPPPPLQVLLPLCRRENTSVALSALSGIARRVPVDRVLGFSNDLTNNTVSVKKAGYRLVFQVSPKPDLCKFLAKICKEEKNAGVREVVGEMVHKVFTQTPSPESWQLMKEFIHDLLPGDKKIYAVLKQLQTINVDYIDDYVLEIFKKINSFSDEELVEEDKSNLILSFLKECKDKYTFNKLPENLITEIVKKTLLECSLEFIYEIYLFFDEEKFEDRLQVFKGIVSENLMQLDKVDTEKPRIYPTVQKIKKKVASYNVLKLLKRNDNKNMSRRFIAGVLEIVALQNFLNGFVRLNLYKVFLEASDAMDFGKKCGENVDNLIKIYNSELVIHHYGGKMEAVLSCTGCYENEQFDIIDGLNSYNPKHGVLIGLKLLRYWNISNYDSKYDQFINSIKNSNDITAQALLNKFLNPTRY